MTSKDWHLNLILDLAVGAQDDQDGCVALTLHVGGALVAGQAIGQDAWARGVADLLAAGDDWTLANSVDEAFEVASKALRDDAVDREVLGLPPRVREFVHLRDVRIRTPGQADTVAPLWRGALADVTGWTLGG